MTPQRRIIAVAILLVVFAAVNIWMTFSAVYSIGREPHENHQNYFIPLKIEDNDTTESEL